MSIYIGDKEIKDLCIGDSSAKEVYLGDAKVWTSISLKTYAEILAMATSEGYPRTNTIAELNTNSQGYYSQLQGHYSTIYCDTYLDYLECIDGISYMLYRIFYHNQEFVLGKTGFD